MRLDQLGEQTCPMARALGEIGDAWSLLILREAFYGRQRFSDFVEHTGAQKTVVSARLKQLVQAGLLRREEYSDFPTRHHYVLTDKGRDLTDVLVLLSEWGKKWVDGAAESAQVTLMHTNCEQELEPELHCAHCGDAVERDSIGADLHRSTTAAAS